MCTVVSKKKKIEQPCIIPCSALSQDNDPLYSHTTSSYTSCQSWVHLLGHSKFLPSIWNLEQSHQSQVVLFFCQNISNCFSRLNNTFYIEQENPPISLRVLSSSHASSSLLDHMKVANSSAMSNSHLQTHPNLIVLSLLVYCILYKPVYIYNDRHLGLVFPKCSESTLRTRPNLHT